MLKIGWGELLFRYHCEMCCTTVVATMKQMVEADGKIKCGGDDKWCQAGGGYIPNGLVIDLLDPDADAVEEMVKVRKLCD